MRNPPRWRAVARPALAGLAPAGLALMAVAMLPPVETLARQYLFVESVQFCLLSMAGPALIVLGAPWRLLRLSRGQAESQAVGLTKPERIVTWRTGWRPGGWTGRRSPGPWASAPGGSASASAGDCRRSSMPWPVIPR